MFEAWASAGRRPPLLRLLASPGRLGYSGLSVQMLWQQPPTPAGLALPPCRTPVTRNTRRPPPVRSCAPCTAPAPAQALGPAGERLFTGAGQLLAPGRSLHWKVFILLLAAPGEGARGAWDRLVARPMPVEGESRAFAALSASPVYPPPRRRVPRTSPWRGRRGAMPAIRPSAWYGERQTLPCCLLAGLASSLGTAPCSWHEGRGGSSVQSTCMQEHAPGQCQGPSTLGSGFGICQLRVAGRGCGAACWKKHAAASTTTPLSSAWGGNPPACAQGGGWIDRSHWITWFREMGLGSHRPPGLMHGLTLPRALSTALPVTWPDPLCFLGAWEKHGAVFNPPCPAQDSGPACKSQQVSGGRFNSRMSVLSWHREPRALHAWKLSEVQ